MGEKGKIGNINGALKKRMEEEGWERKKPPP